MSTPRPIYFKHGVIEFYVRNQIVNYRTRIWTENGMCQFVAAQGVYQNNSEELLKQAQQNFGDVS